MCNCLNDAVCDPYDGKCISSVLNRLNFTENHSEPDCGVSSAIVGQISHGDSFPHGLFPW